MKKSLFLVGALLFSLIAWSQRPTLKIENPYKKSNKPTRPILSGTDEEQVRFIVQELFDAMHAADSFRIKGLFAPEARLLSTSFDQNNKPVISEMAIPAFITNIGKSEKGLLNEVIFNTEVKIEDNLASVWTDYNFYVGDKLNHCGVDAFQLFKGNDGWQIIHVSDTRKKDGCQSEPVNVIDELLDGWHVAAANADVDAYFGAFAEDGIFLGTDVTEKWDLDEFQKMTASAFRNKSAWDFKSTDRQVNFSDDGNLAWFEETLDTWMGVCRGSGVLAKVDDHWKIKQYNLAILVPNDKVNDYIKLLGN